MKNLERELIIDFWRKALTEQDRISRESVINQILNHKFNTINAETALMVGNTKISTVDKKVVIDYKEIVELLQTLTNKE